MVGDAIAITTSLPRRRWSRFSAWSWRSREYCLDVGEAGRSGCHHSAVRGVGRSCAPRDVPVVLLVAVGVTALLRLLF